MIQVSDDGYYYIDIASHTQWDAITAESENIFAAYIFFLSSSVKHFLVIHQNARAPVSPDISVTRDLW